MSHHTTPEWAWRDGQFLRWEECRIHARSQAVLTGVSVFEGIRAYASADDEELYLFRFADHMRRLAQSLKIARIPAVVPPNLEEVCAELLVLNGWHEDVHIAPFACLDVSPDFGFLSDNPNVTFVITAVARPRARAIASGASLKVSSYTRISEATTPPRVKTAANYHNSRLAALEARVDGYDNAVLLNHRGTVAEAPDACVAIVRDGRLITPPVVAGLLESVTRSTVIQLAAETLGVPVEEREVDRSELYVADEAFLCGTGAEITPVVSFDRIEVGAGRPGPLTLQLQEAYYRVARGMVEDHSDWRTAVYHRSGAPSTAPSGAAVA
jgi:branched-chain amino acid aminotransferase